jgi:hypothetical protein
MRDAERVPITASGLILRYPDGWRGIATPLVMLKSLDTGHKFFYMRSLDLRVRAKQFALIRRTDRLDAELIYEENATENDMTVEVPTWEVGPCDDPQVIYAAQARHTEQAAVLQPWETRHDVPNWARQIALVVTLHMQHNTGYIFNDYAKALRTLKWIAQHIEARRVLVYLPGWEGRYYWQYGDYRPRSTHGQ